MIRGMSRGLTLLLAFPVMQIGSPLIAQTFSTEGPITDIDPVNGIITVNYLFKVKVQPSLSHEVVPLQ